MAEQNAKKSEKAVEQAKQLVMKMGQEVLQNKNQVAEKVEAFNKVVTDAVDAVGAVKTDAVGAVETAGTEQTKKVSDEGAKQVKAVEDKGNEVLQSIPEDFTVQMQNKLDKQQGVENKGKALVVGEDGNVVPGKVQSGGIMKLVRKFTIPQDITQEPSDITYIVSDDGKVKMFMVDKDGNGQPLRLRRFIIFLKKNSIIGNDTIPLSNMGVRINVNITENKNHMLWYRSVNNKTQSLYFDIEKIGVSAKGHAYSFSLGSDYTYYSTMTSVDNASVSFYENMFKDNNEPIHTISIIEPSYKSIDLRGATVTIYGEVM